MGADPADIAVGDKSGRYFREGFHRARVQIKTEDLGTVVVGNIPDFVLVRVRQRRLGGDRGLGEIADVRIIRIEADGRQTFIVARRMGGLEPEPAPIGSESGIYKVERFLERRDAFAQKITGNSAVRVGPGFEKRMPGQVKHVLSIATRFLPTRRFTSTPGFARGGRKRPDYPLIACFHPAQSCFERSSRRDRLT